MHTFAMLALAAGLVAAQPAEEVDPKQLPAQARVGYRVQQVRSAVRVLPTVVIVPDAWSFRRAIAQWTRVVRFPVLIDDGSAGAREDVARFVRAFAPTSVVRWAEKAPAEAVDIGGLVRDVARAWGWSGDGEARAFIKEEWRERHPVGLVVVDGADPAWTAGLALAAWHGQWIVEIPAPGEIDGVMDAAGAEAWCGKVEAACEAMKGEFGWAWSEIGDDIEMVTIAQNCPVKAWVNGKDVVAITDKTARHVHPGKDGAKAGRRWGWAGQVFGSEAQGAYRAMCAAFLSPTSAWVFDAYEEKKPFDQWDGTAAARMLREGGWAVALDDTPKQGEREWRTRAARAMDVGLVLVNSMGNSDFFQLQPGLGRPGDAPILKAPTVVHMVHSWSLQWPGSRDTVGGRWLERGAYAYFGSVQEPYLQAFVPTPTLVGRWGAGAPYGIAARLDDAAVWRLAMIGDPLIMMGPGLIRENAALALEGAEDVGVGLEADLKSGRFAEGIGRLVLMGRDADAARLVGALLKEKGDALTPEAAEAGFMSVFRAGADSDLVGCWGKLGKEARRRGDLRDALWLMAYPVLSNGQASEGLLEALRGACRAETMERDATELGRAWARANGRGSAREMLGKLRDEQTKAELRAAVERAIPEVK